MFLLELYDISAESKIKKLEDILRESYGIEIDWESSTEDLLKSKNYYEVVKHKALMENNFNDYFENENYSKAFLITEAIRIFLSEVAPKRRLFKRKTK